MVAFALAGCHTASQRGRAGDTGSVALPTAAPDSAAFVRDTTPVVRPSISRPPALAETTGAKPVTAVPPRYEPDRLASVREILASSSLVGRRVRVAGTCLGYSRPRAVGGPPRTRSDWQLEAEGVAIYVTGPVPPGCSLTDGAKESTTILALVAEDTLPAQ